jgi:hypothetical protein
MPATISKFMERLMNALRDEKNLSDTTIKQYIESLYLLNDRKPFTSLMFLKDFEGTMTKLSDYADSTKINRLALIVSVLDLYKHTKNYKPIWKLYKFELDKRVADRETKGTSDMTERENEAWITWKEVMDIRKSYDDQVAEFSKLKKLDGLQWPTMLKTLVLHLYTDLPPRRNKDFTLMQVGRSITAFDPAFNYLDLDTGKMHFFNYKTAKREGSKVIDVPEPLMKVITEYLRLYPGQKPTNKRLVPLLVGNSGQGLKSVNAMTRILNTIFKRNIGSSMLRHIYLSDNLGDTIKKLDETAAQMSHTRNTQSRYVRMRVSEVDSEDD